MQEAGKSMLENVNTYKRLQEDYKEYIELWIHEIKIPIATSKLIIENNKNEITKSIDEELDEIENYTGNKIEEIQYTYKEKENCDDEEFAFDTSEEIEKVEDTIFNVAFEFQMEYFVDISVVIKNEEQFNYWLGALPFYDNVEKEGIVIG